MTTISGIVYSALSALNTYSAAIDVTNTNIANVETTGYSRQRAVIQTKDSVSTTAGTLGTGVQVSKIERIYDSFLTAQARLANQALGKWEVENESLSTVEEAFSATDLSSALSDFWSSWDDVVNDPSGSTARSVLASAADTLADAFNSISSDLSEIQKDIDNSVVETVDSINELVEQVADLNEKIAQANAAGLNTNTYEDSLDTLVSQLSELTDINATTNSAGQVCIQLSDGKPLVAGTATWSLSTETNSTTGLKDVTWVDSSGNSTVVTDDISSGKLGGYLEVRDEIIPAYQDQLDELAVSIMEQVNTLQTSGYDINGDAGVSFFTGTGAGDMAVDADILDDPGKIAAAATADGGTSDGSNASAVAELENSLVLDSGTSTFSEYYSSLVSKIGTAVSSVDTKYSAQSDLVTYYEDQIASVSGVSTDEEEANLVLYQSAYEAAAKMISTLDELLQTLIDM